MKKSSMSKKFMKYKSKMGNSGMAFKNSRRKI